MRYYITLALFFIPIIAHSQANYQKGVVTDKNNKVISGFINYREWESNPKQIEFKNNKDDKTAQVFYPRSINAFAIEGLETYLSYTGKISMNKTKFPDLPEGKDTSKKYGSFFLKNVATGKNITLLSYTDSLKTRYFVQDKQESLPTELLYQEYYNDSKLVLSDNRFLGQLSNLINKYVPVNASLLNQLESLKYGTDIIAIVNKINGNESTEVKNSSPHIRFFAGLALNVTKTGFDDNIYFKNGKTPNALTPRLTGGLDFFNNVNVQKVVFRLQLDLSYVNFDLSQPSNPIVTGYSYNQHTATITPQVIWNIYNSHAFKFYLAGGVGVNFSNYTNNKFTEAPNYITMAPYKLSSLWINYPVQTGIVVNKQYEIFASYTAATSYINSGSSSLSNEVYSAGVHYLFNRKIK